MSEENVELLRKVYDAFNRRDLDAALELVDDAVEGVPRIAAIEGSYHGQEGMRRFWQNFLDAFPDMTAEVGEARNLGDLTVAAVHLHGQGASSGLPSDQQVWQIVRWRRGKCVWWRVFDTQHEALQAVGRAE